ncbi:hypothetical protein M8J77_010297 [Diaphorina citri]|nr:hypothetical protein M8J77_010297 [Diaphorina citri]
MSLSRLSKQVTEALKTVEVFIDTTHVSKNNAASVAEIKNKFIDLKENLQGMIGSLDEDAEVRTKDLKVPDSSEMLDYREFMTQLSKNRNPSALRELTILLAKMPPDTIFLGVGSPNPNLYPFESMTVKLKDGTTLDMSGPKLTKVLQYLPSAGYTPLPPLLKDFQDKFHGAQDWTRKDILITSGAQEGTYLAMNMLLNPGDPLLVQNPLYPGFADIFRPMEVETIPIHMDENGMRPDLLAQVLEERSKMKHKKMPKVLYVNPTASNPTGTLLSEDRKKQIYQIARQYDLIILEDDPYYFVHFLDKDPLSFLSMDQDQRVIRFDSFSKTLSAGLRLGYVTAPKAFIDRMNLHLQVTTMHSSGIGQLVAHELLSTWGCDGYRKYLAEVRKFYKGRRDNVLQAADKYLTGLGTWAIPQGGMFLWVTLKPVKDLRSLVTEQCVREKLLVAPGYAFNIDSKDSNQYIRISYSVATEEQAQEGIKVLGKLIRENLKS